MCTPATAPRPRRAPSPPARAASRQAGRRIGVCFVPRATFLCTAILRDAKALQHVTIHGARPAALLLLPLAAPLAAVNAAFQCVELGVDMIPLEDDVLSMELGTAFRVRSAAAPPPFPSAHTRTPLAARSVR